MKKRRSKRAFLAAGWIAGIAAVLLLGVVWPSAFPGIVNVQHYYAYGPALPAIVIGAMVVASPAAALGGLVGSRMPREGGRTEQILVAGLMGIILALPFGCLIFWFFSSF